METLSLDNNESIVEEVSGMMGNSFKIKDPLPVVLKKKREEKALNRIKAVKKNKLKMEFKNQVGKLFTTIFYIKLIQKIEPLLMVISIDLIFMTMIGSILYLLYLVVGLSDDFNWIQILFKMIGSVVVTLMSILILGNIQQEIEKKEE
jgi:hypothetical protein